MCLLLLFGFSNPLSGQNGSDPILEVVPLSQSAVIVRAVGPQPTNILAFNSEAGIVLVDTGISPTLADAIRTRIQEVYSRNDFAYVINTHDHGDHTYGNQAFSDVTIVGQEAGAGLLRGGAFPHGHPGILP